MYHLSFCLQFFNSLLQCFCLCHSFIALLRPLFDSAFEKLCWNHQAIGSRCYSTSAIGPLDWLAMEKESP